MTVRVRDVHNYHVESKAHITYERHTARTKSYSSAQYVPLRLESSHRKTIVAVTRFAR